MNQKEKDQKESMDRIRIDLENREQYEDLEDQILQVSGVYIPLY